MQHNKFTSRPRKVLSANVAKCSIRKRRQTFRPWKVLSVNVAKRLISVSVSWSETLFEQGKTMCICRRVCNRPRLWMWNTGQYRPSSLSDSTISCPFASRAIFTSKGTQEEVTLRSNDKSRPSFSANTFLLPKMYRLTAKNIEKNWIVALQFAVRHQQLRNRVKLRRNCYNVQVTSLALHTLWRRTSNRPGVAGWWGCLGLFFRWGARFGSGRSFARIARFWRHLSFHFLAKQVGLGLKGKV